MEKNKLIILVSFAMIWMSGFRAGDGLYVISALEIVIALFLLTLLTKEENDGTNETSEGGA